MAAIPHVKKLNCYSVDDLGTYNFHLLHELIIALQDILLVPTYKMIRSSSQKCSLIKFQQNPFRPTVCHRKWPPTPSPTVVPYSLSSRLVLVRVWVIEVSN